jgi:hypothetical protein
VLACSAWNAPSVPHGENSEPRSAVLRNDRAHSGARLSRFRRSAVCGGHARSPRHLPRRLHARRAPGPRRLSQLWSPCWPRARLTNRMLAMPVSLSAPSTRPRPAPGLCRPCGYHVGRPRAHRAGHTSLAASSHSVFSRHRSQTQVKSGCSPLILNL